MKTLSAACAASLLLAGCGEQQRNNVLQQKFQRELFSELPLRISGTHVNWTEQTPGSASGYFSANAQATESLYQSVDRKKGLAELGFREDYGEELAAAFQKAADLERGIVRSPTRGAWGWEETQTRVETTPGTRAELANLKIEFSRESMEFGFYDHLLPLGGQVDLWGHVRLIKYGNKAWHVTGMEVVSTSLQGVLPTQRRAGWDVEDGGAFIWESDLQRGHYLLRDPGTPQAVQSILDRRRRYIDRVDRLLENQTRSET